MTPQTICVLGLGYIGLPTASMFATHGFRVVGVDVDRRVVDLLSRGGLHIQEPGLRTIVQAALNSGNLTVSTQPEPADVFIICVPTPITEQRTADLQYVQSAARMIVPALRPGALVILESTVPPGTTGGLLAAILERSGLTVGADLFIAHAPERVIPGKVLYELVQNDRVVGGLSPAAAAMARDLYATFVKGRIHVADATTAEMVKLMENTYRDVNIALANEFGRIAEALAVDAWSAIEIANRHPRVDILRPGPGVGGHCIAVDPWFLVQAAPDRSRLIACARAVNDAMPAHVVQLVQKQLAHRPDPVIAALGITYKGDVDDVRESPAIEVVEGLLEEGCTVRIYDPHVSQLEGLSQHLAPLADAVAGADCLLVLADHTDFRYLDPRAIGPAVRDRILIDTRNALDHARWRQEGFRVVPLGDGRRTSPGEGRRTSPGEGRRTSPGEGRRTSPGEGRRTSPGPRGEVAP